MKRKTKTAFSLVKLIIVVAVLGILAAVVVPQMGSYIAKATLNQTVQQS